VHRRALADCRARLRDRALTVYVDRRAPQDMLRGNTALVRGSCPVDRERNRSQSPVSRQIAQFSTISRIAWRSAASFGMRIFLCFVALRP
jgi:hypothetical protein